MAEYIERAAVLAEMISKPLPNDASHLYFAIRGIVRKAPAADVVEVKHGEWIIKCDDYDCELMCCSICESEFYDGDNDTVDSLHNYCPNCGAKMDLKEGAE